MLFLGKMSKFVESPNLPQRARIVALGEKYADILDKPLKTQGLSPLYAPNNPDVDPRLSGHADLSVFHAGWDRIFLAPYLRYTDFAKKLTEIGFLIEYTDINQNKKYPFDAQLNIAAFGKHFVYGKKTAYSSIVRNLTIDEHMSGLAINQGYAKCATVVVDENSIITADRGEAQACLEAGIDVLLVEPGHVELPGFEYGFLGGASFKLSKNAIAFTGALDKHPDKERILDFLHERGVSPVYLTEKAVFDVGSILPLTER